MHREDIYVGGRRTTFVYRAAIKVHAAPRIKKEFVQDGVRFYKDALGRIHVADTVDRIFRKPDPGAILPVRNRKYQPSR